MSDSASDIATSDPPTGDRLLAARLVRGDEEAFETFFEGYFPPLYRFALSRLGQDADAAEEVVQATLCKAVTKVRTYRGEAALLSWLCTFCRHEISAWYERRGRRPSEVPLAEDVPEVRAALESLARTEDADPSRVFERAEVRRCVLATLDQLPPTYGNALEWKYIQGLSVKEIAHRLRLGPKAAESLLTRARNAFRDAFAAIAEAHQEPERTRS